MRRQVIEVTHQCHRQRQLSQRLIQFLALHEALRNNQPLALQSERQIDQVFAVLLLTLKSQLGARRPIAKCRLPVQRGHRLLDLHAREAARVESADNGAHARAGDRIDGHVQAIEHLEHADVGRAARATTGKHEPDARPRRGRHLAHALRASRGAAQQQRRYEHYSRCLHAQAAGSH